VAKKERRERLVMGEDKRAESEGQPGREQFLEARTVVDFLVRRAVGNQEFREQLKADPIEKFKEFGIPAAFAEDFAREMVVDGDVLEESCTISCSWTCSWTGI
jgi:hypothetical protein